jgi:hypothetical protein
VNKNKIPSSFGPALKKIVYKSAFKSLILQVAEIVI